MPPPTMTMFLGIVKDIVMDKQDTVNNKMNCKDGAATTTSATIVVTTSWKRMISLLATECDKYCTTIDFPTIEDTHGFC